MSDWENKIMKHRKKRNFLQSLKCGKYYKYYYCPHAKKVCKGFEIKNEGEYHDLHDQSNTLLLANVFENFRNMCYEIYGLDPAKFLSASGLAWQVPLKKTKVKLNLLTDIDMMLMVEKVSDAWLKPYIEKSTDLKKKQKTILKKIFQVDE